MKHIFADKTWKKNPNSGDCSQPTAVKHKYWVLQRTEETYLDWKHNQYDDILITKVEEI
jgi:hypothetical protein